MKHMNVTFKSPLSLGEGTGVRLFFRKLHLWLSLPFGIIITLICFSGAMLVFEYEVTKCVKPEAFRTEQVSEPKPSEEVRKPRRKVVPRDERLPFFRTMFRLHRWLLGNRPQPGGGIHWGKMVVGISTLLFVVVLVTGVVIWWPRTRKALVNSLKLPVRKGWRRFCYGLHVAGGMYALLLLLVMALTGLTWSFGWYREWFYEFFGVNKGWVYGVHVGSFGGMVTRVLWFLAALLGATLPLTGYYLWWKRVRRRR